MCWRERSIALLRRKARWTASEVVENPADLLLDIRVPYGGQFSRHGARGRLESSCSTRLRLPLPVSDLSGLGPSLGLKLETTWENAVRVLVVDDNVHAAQSLSTVLKLWGHNVDVAHDGPDGLQRAQNYQPDAILLDIGLPRLDGYGVARRLRELPGLADTLLIALTGYGEDEDRQRALDSGFDHHMIKPVDLHALEGLLASRGAAGIAHEVPEAKSESCGVAQHVK
jgi:CheY-like chemotaxis protein